MKPPLPLFDAPGLPRGVPYLAVPGFEGRLAAGPDRTVYRLDGRPELPPPWDRCRWKRLKPFDVGGVASVRLRAPDGRELVRSAALLWRAASAPEPERWAPRLLRRLSRATDLPPPAAAGPVEYRPAPGMPGYRVGSDCSLWTCLRRGNIPWAERLPPDPGPADWRRLRPQNDSGIYRVRVDGRPVTVSARKLRREAFGEAAPPPDAPAIAAGQAVAELVATAEAPPVADPLLTPFRRSVVPPPDARDVPGFDGYRISRGDRSVWSLRGKRRWTLLPPMRRPRGGPAVRLQRDGRTCVRSVERLHRAAFPPPPPPPPPEPLRLADVWADAPRGERHGRAKMTQARAAEMRADRARGLTYPELAARFGVSRGTVFNILSGRTWPSPAPEPEM